MFEVEYCLARATEKLKGVGFKLICRVALLLISLFRFIIIMLPYSLNNT